MIPFQIIFLFTGDCTHDPISDLLMSEPKSSRCLFCIEMNYSFGHLTMQGAASQMLKYLHLFVTPWAQPQHCSVGSAAGNNLLCSLELPYLSISNFGTGVLTNQDCLGHLSSATIKLSKQGEGEVVVPCVPLPMKDRVRLLVSTEQPMPTLPPCVWFAVQRFAS